MTTVYTEELLNDLKVDDLKKILDELGVESKAKKKDDLVAAILESQGDGDVEEEEDDDLTRKERRRLRRLERNGGELLPKWLRRMGRGLPLDRIGGKAREIVLNLRDEVEDLEEALKQQLKRAASEERDKVVEALRAELDKARVRSGADKHEEVVKRLKAWTDAHVFGPEVTSRMRVRVGKLPLFVPVGELGSDILIELLDIAGLFDFIVAVAYGDIEDDGEFGEVE